jgi:hypothetical protein
MVIREVLAPFTGHPFDFELWLRLGYYVSQGRDPYSITAPVPGLSFPGAQYMTWIGYPPTWAFLQVGLYRFYLILGVKDRFLYYFIVKQPMVIADLVAGYLLFRLISDLKNDGAGTSAFVFWMLCPFVIIISSVWGIFDQIILVLVLGSILTVRETQKSALMESLGFLLKVLPLIYFPLMAFVQETKQKIAIYLTVSVGSSILFVLLPYVFFKDWNLSQLIGVGVSVASKLGGSMNYWIVFSVYSSYRILPPVVESLLNLLAFVWIPSVLIATWFCLKCIRDRENFTRNLCLSTVFVTLVFFLTKSIVNEQYLIYFLGIGLVDYYVLESKARKKLFHAMWLAGLAFLAANNTYFTRFLEPLSTYYKTLDTMLETGVYGEIRYGILIASGLVFTAFTLAYSVSVYRELRKIRDSDPSSPQQPLRIQNEKLLPYGRT